MSSIKGRSDDMLIIRGVNLFHTQVEEVIHEIQDLSPNYRLIVERQGTMDSVKVEVETDEKNKVSHEALGALLKSKIKDTVGLSMDIDIKEPNSIPRSQGGKLSRIVDNRVKYNLRQELHSIL